MVLFLLGTNRERTEMPDTHKRVARPRTLVIASSHGSTKPSSLSSMSTGYGVRSSLGGGTTRTAVLRSDAHIQAEWRRVSRAAENPLSRRARHGSAHTAAYLPAHGIRDLCLKILDAHAGIRVDLDVVEFLSSSERGSGRKGSEGWAPLSVRGKPLFLILLVSAMRIVPQPRFLLASRSRAVPPQPVHA